MLRVEDPCVVTPYPLSAGVTPTFNHSSRSTAAARESERRRPAGLLRQRRREALVVELDGNAHGAAQALGERARLAGLGGVAAGRATAAGRRRRARPPARAPARDAREALARAGPQDRLERRGQRPGRVGHRDAAAGAAVVEREDPQTPSARSISARAAGSASGSFSGSRPPAWAMRVAPAAAAADDLRRRLDDRRRPSRRARPRPGVAATSRLDAPVAGRAEDDHGGVAELVLEPVGEVGQRLRVVDLLDLEQRP